MTESNIKCGFCRRGDEVENICGQLWYSSKHSCAAHHRCMQYSARLVQYKCSEFGGFKIDKVQNEITRGKFLKCSICRKSSDKKWRKVGGATAGCAIKRCSKTFHYYCAATQAIVKRIEMTVKETGNKILLYRVFCGLDHLKQYEKQESNEIHYLSHSEEDTDSDATEIVSPFTNDTSSPAVRDDRERSRSPVDGLRSSADKNSDCTPHSATVCEHNDSQLSSVQSDDTRGEMRGGTAAPQDEPEQNGTERTAEG